MANYINLMEVIMNDEKDRLDEIEERGWSLTAQCAEDWRWLIDEVRNLKDQIEVTAEFDWSIKAEAERLKVENDRLRLEVEAIKRS